jgi:hypothetical protein
MKFLWYVFNPQVELTVGGLMPDIFGTPYSLLRPLNVFTRWSPLLKAFRNGGART